MIEYDIEIKDDLDMTIRYRAVGGELRSKIDSIMKEAAHKAATYMALHAPYHSGQLYRSINVSREPNFGYKPGGAGGGGFFEIHVGINEDMAPHADWVIGGTGIFGPTGNIIQPQGNIMVFQKGGEGDVFARWTRGQHPQTSWFEDAYKVAESSIRYHLARI